MCYASPVMLRGRCSCAISDRPTPSLFATLSLFRPLSLIIPVHPRTAPVSPIIPVHTQKQGGGGYICSLFVLPSSVPGARPACPELLGDPVGVSGACPGPVGMVSPLPPFSFSPLATRHSRPSSVIPGGSNRLENLAPNCTLSAVNCRLSPLSPIIPAPLATAALRVVPAPICTTTLRIHVGAPTILFRERTTASQQFPDRRAMPSSNCALSTVGCELLFSPNSNHSRTYAPVARKSNYSRTYAKQGGGVEYLHGNVP